MAKVHEVIHSSPEIKTVYDYIVQTNSEAFAYTDQPESFLEVKNTKGQTNRESIESTYTSKAERDKYKGKSTKELLLKVGTRLAIEQGKANKSALMLEGFEVVSNDIPAFKAKMLAELESKETYKVKDYIKPVKGMKKKGAVRQEYPDVTVWVWCKALTSAANNYEGEIFNLTPFIESVTTDVGKNGGNFQITLPPLICELNEKGQWAVKKNHIQFYQGQNLSLQKADYVSQGYVHQENEAGEMYRSNFLFHNMISAQDLVWIRFETLQVEQDQRIEDSEQLFISKNSLPDRVYDMIGLVDVNDITYNAASVDVSVTLPGRDLMKLLIEDGTYFYNLELTQGMLGGPGSAQNKGLLQRLAADKALQYLSLFYNNSIEDIIKFVVNQLSSVKVVPDSLFSAYGDRRNTRVFEENKEDVNKRRTDDREMHRKRAIEGIANIRKSVGVADPAPTEERKKVDTVGSQLFRFLQDIRDKKVRETNASNRTIGWKPFTWLNERGVKEPVDDSSYPDYFGTELFNISVTREVPEILPIVNDLDAIIDIDRGITPYTSTYENKPAPGIWQIIKLVLDEGITARRPIDSSVSSANGSLLNFFRKVCQDPFVEFYGDTYGDMYHLIARKPPTDKEGIISMLKGQVVTEDKNGPRVTPTVIDIEPDDVIYEQLSMDDTEAYTWYHLTPYANLFGTDQFSLSYLPAIFFEEYAEIWGSRPMQVQHNYMPVLTSDAPKSDLDLVQKQAVEDLRYVIQSSAYLPFTRKGVIKTNGDRRYKVGNLVRHKDTGEIFHIDHVHQEFRITENSIERVSTIQVSRGMVEKLIYGIPANSIPGGDVNGYISYFNIVDTRPIYEYKDITEYTEERVAVGQREVSTGDSTPANISLLDTYPGDSIIESGNINMWVLNDLPAGNRKKFVQLINAINARGYKVAIKDADAGMRTYERQVALHRANGNNAKPGNSRHEIGRALDINLINKGTGRQYRKADSKYEWTLTGVPQLAKSFGFKWGGDFNGYNDPVHFEIADSVASGGTTVETVYETRQKPVHSKALDTDKIFSNFKVNKTVFNFFLRQQQKAQQYKDATDKSVFDDNGNSTMKEVIISTKK
jgi:hypothetical protein